MKREDKRQVVTKVGTGTHGNSSALSPLTPMQRPALGSFSSTLVIYTAEDKAYYPLKISTDITSRFQTGTKAKILVGVTTVAKVTFLILRIKCLGKRRRGSLSMTHNLKDDYIHLCLDL